MCECESMWRGEALVLNIVTTAKNWLLFMYSTLQGVGVSVGRMNSSYSFYTVCKTL